MIPLLYYKNTHTYISREAVYTSYISFLSRCQMFESWHAFKLAMGRKTRPGNLKPAKSTKKYPNSPFLKPKPQISQRRRQILIKTFNGSYCFTKCLRSLLSSMFAHLTQFFHVLQGILLHPNGEICPTSFVRRR